MENQLRQLESLEYVLLGCIYKMRNGDITECSDQLKKSFRIIKGATKSIRFKIVQDNGKNEKALEEKNAITKSLEENKITLANMRKELQKKK